MLNNLKDIESSLETLLNELDTELSASNQDNSKFHENLIELLSKYPNEKEIIQFIVFINDRLETSHTISKEILSDSVKGLIKQKQYLIKRLIAEADIKENEDKKISMVEYIQNNKAFVLSIIATIAVIGICTMLFFVPKEVIEVLKIIAGIIKG